MKAQNIHASKYKWLEKGKKVWIQSISTGNFNKAFEQAIVQQINEEKHVIIIENSEGEISQIGIQRCLKCTYGAADVSDMVDLEELNEPQLLWNINRRYENDFIFTLCGPTLLIINPYREIQKLFTDDLLFEHQALAFSQSLQYKSQQPHIYGLAGFCLWQLFDNDRNQSIVISGQSGAGKTQNTKYCLKFLASMGKNIPQICKRNSSNAREARILANKLNANNSKLHGMQDKILGCNEILQAFGNAKTIRNDNSSRFGKLIILLYGVSKVDIRSAFITNYLLQKSRIVSISKGERNYHVFYFFCKGCSQQERKKYKLTLPIEKYYFLNQSDEYKAGNINDQAMFQRLKSQFLLYLIPEEIECVLSIVSAVLNLGNIQFSIRLNEKKQQFIVIKGQQFVKNAAQLIDVNPQELSRSLQYKKRIFKDELTQTPFRLDEAIAMRDSFAKNLYEKLFNFLVLKLNNKIQLQKIDLQDIQNRSIRKSIGILDIFGFQILHTNSLQQFFINFANQKLQQLYVSYIFKQEQNEFNRQGLEKFSYQFNFTDNKQIIQMIQNYPQGIMHLINEASELNKIDSSLPQTITRTHRNQHVTIPRFRTDFFLINHSVNPIQYCSKGFIAKNKDQFPSQMIDLIDKIKRESMRNIINFDLNHGKVVKGKSKFLSTQFLKQIKDLIEQLYSSDCHFVRCIKPNQQKKPKMFNSVQVLQSLRNLGVLDSIKIRKQGFVYRRPFKQFCKKFIDLQSYNYNSNKLIQQKSQEELKQMAKKIVLKYAPKDLQQNHILFGHNKILINEQSINNFQSQARQKRRQRINVSNRLKTAYKKHIFRQYMAAFLFQKNTLRNSLMIFKKKVIEQIKIEKIRKIQKSIKSFLAKIHWKKIQALDTCSVIIISKWWRMISNRRKFIKSKQNVIKIQSHIIKYLDNRKIYKQKVICQQINTIFNKSWILILNIKALKIQKIFRGFTIRSKFKEQIKQIQQAKKQAMRKMHITTIQKWWRYKVFKKSMSKYLLAAQKIQATFKAHLLSTIFKKVTISTIVIQKAMKKYINQKGSINKIWDKYQSTLKKLEIERTQQLMQLGISIKQTKISLRYPLNPRLAKVQVASPVDTKSHFLSKQVFLPNKSLKDFYINNQDKNDFQACILDVDIISSIRDSYSSKWGDSFKVTIQIMKQKLQYPIKIEVSDTFTCVISQKGKMYQFGQVDNLTNKQLESQKIFPFKIICHESSGYLLNTERQLFTWGNNDSDQLMKGFSSGPCRFEQNTFLHTQKIDNIQVKGKNKYLLSSGKVYEYPTQISKIKTNQKFQFTKPLAFQTKIWIQQIIASYNFVHFLSTSGQLFSKGSNSKGQLGLGHNEKVNEPQQNLFFKNNKQIIDTISVGFRHTICKTRLGYVYSWGQNSYKQVCDQQNQYCSRPQKIEAQKAAKILFAVAGFRCSAVLLQNSKVYHWGTNSTLSKSGFQRFQYQKQYLFGNNNISALVPLKLNCTWSRNLSIIYINAMNHQKCKKMVTKQNIFKTVKNLSKQWNAQKIFPPYNEIAQNNLNLSDLKKYKFKQFGLRQRISEQPTKNPFKQIEMLAHSKGHTIDFSSLNMAAKQKLQQLLKTLLSKSQDQEWSQEQIRLFQYLQNPKIQKLIKKL